MKIIFNLFVTVIFSLSILFQQTQGLCAEEALDWKGCLVEARVNNPDLISAVENISQQKSAKTITASSLYPQINADLNASTSKTGKSSSQNLSSATSGDSYSYGATGSQLIFDGFKTLNEVNTAKQNIETAKQSYRFASSEIRLSLRNAFVKLLEAQELVKVVEGIIKIRRDNLELITMRYYSGLEHKGALLTAQANLSQANYELAQAKRNVEFFQRQLTKEMGRKEFMPILVSGNFVVRDTAKIKPDFEVIVKNNPSVLEAAAKKAAAFYNVRSAYGNFSPQLIGSASVDKAGSSWPPATNQWNAGLGLSVPIFEGGLRVAQVSQAKSELRQAGENERSVRDTAVVSLEQSWVLLQDTLEFVNVQKQILNATEERSRIAEAQYSIGFISFDNWIIIEDDLVKAKKNYLLAQSDALLAEAGWIQAKGETLEYE